MVLQPFDQSPLVSSFGRQIPGHRPSSPQCGFGSATRATAAAVSAPGYMPVRGELSPGPIYGLEGGVGPQHDSSKTSEPQWGFGSNPRSKSPRAQDIGPGPAEYSSDGMASMGTQPLSQKGTSPIYGMGSGTRETQRKLFISAEHQKDLYGRNTPGPTTAVDLGAYGRQVPSTRRSSPSWGLHGPKNRFNERPTSAGFKVPGPQAYGLRSGVGTQARGPPFPARLKRSPLGTHHLRPRKARPVPSHPQTLRGTDPGPLALASSTRGSPRRRRAASAARRASSRRRSTLASTTTPRTAGSRPAPRSTRPS